MPHDKKGRLVEVGDHVKFKTWDGAHKLSVGRVFSVNPGSDTCNVSVVHLTPGYWPISQAAVTARETELVLKADGSEPFEPPAPSMEDAGQAGRARVGVLAILAAIVALALPMVARAQAPEPACGEVLAPKPCVSFTTGVVTVVTRGERGEYATVGGSLEAPLPWGLSSFAHVDAFGVQDGGSLNFSSPQSYRAIKLEAGVGKRAGAFVFSARGGATFSIEGDIGAPVDPRAFDALIEAALRLDDGGHLAVRGGHDGTVGGWAAGADVEIPVASGPSIVARYQFPFVRDASGRLPWVVTAGGRVRVKSFRLHLH